MKILAIRGKNLASLARQFEVDFATEPLANTGIFAITGPTGAGKSTLLDALCLALYDDMPRLPREGVRQNLPDVSGETIAPRDPRNILRRGAAEGFAEVDFVGNDELTYRAHWSVRRAYSKSGGKLQASELSLIRLDNQQPIGGTRKTEVLVAIAERIGLSFEQFTRAVLLAQNEFATFLKASDDKRAELLQTLTGTDLFADLSRRAYQRSKNVDNQLNSLRDRLNALAVLTPEERQQQELAYSQAQLQVRALEAERGQLEQQLQWYQQAEQFQQACQLAAQALNQAQEQEHKAGERRQFLATLETVQAARGWFESLDRSCQELLTSRTQLQASQAQQISADSHYQQTLKQLSIAKQQATDQQAAYQTLQPVLLQARQLDTIIQTLLPRHEAAFSEHTTAQTLVDHLQSQQLVQTQALAELTAKQDQIQAWLVQHARWQTLAEHWQHWQNLLQQAQAVLVKQQSGEAELIEVIQSIEQSQAASTACQLSLVSLQHQLKQAEEQYQTTQQAVAHYDLEALAQQRQVLEQERLQLQAAQQTWQHLQTSQQTYTQLEITNQQVHLEQTECEKQLNQLVLALPLLERDTERAEHAWRLAEAACADQAAVWRAQLKLGDACPVCGAFEHPYTHQQLALDAVLARLQDAYRHQRQALKTLEAQLASEQARFKQYQLQQTSLQHNLSSAKQAYEQAQVHWQVFSPLVKEPESNLTILLQAKQQAIVNIQGQEQTARQHYQQLELAQKTWQQVQQQVLELEAQLRAHAAERQQLQTKQHYLEQSQTDLATQVKTSLQALNVAFEQEDWQATWLSASEAFIKHCQQQVSTWQTQQQNAQALAQQQVALSAAQTKLNFELQQAQQNLQRCQQQTQQLELDLQTQQVQRSRLLTGQSVETVETAWKEKLAGLEQAMALAQQNLEQAQQAQIRTAEAVTQLQALLNQQEARQAQAQQALTAQLEAFKQAGLVIDAADLPKLLGYSTVWLQQEREFLQALQTATSQAQAVLAERQAQLSQHASLRVSEQSFEWVQAQYTEHLISLQTAQQVQQELVLVLREDLQRREQATDLQTELDKLSGQARVWGQLNELIGSASGNKFRDFAQRYSLDVLLSYANRHLVDLSRRYTLRRVRESLALLVLDQDMGGEIRSVHSLSGGESFLVSLALALGLASLSSQRVKVESLFIDEGFGSLDTDSLRIAMDALDQLQAQGRKVGVISHVQDMTERIAVQIQVRRLSGGQSYIRVSEQ